MRHLVVLCLLVGILMAAPGWAQRALPHGDLTRLDWEGKYLPNKGPEHGDYTAGSERYDISRTRLELRLDYAGDDEAQIEGLVHHVFESLDDTLQTVILDLATDNGLTVDAVSSGRLTLPFQHVDDALLVRFPTPLAAGRVDSVTVVYRGSPTSPDDRRGHDQE